MLPTVFVYAVEDLLEYFITTFSLLTVGVHDTLLLLIKRCAARSACNIPLPQMIRNDNNYESKNSWSVCDILTGHDCCMTC